MSFFQQYYNKTPGTLRKDKTPETLRKYKTPGILKNVKQQLGTLKNIVTGKNKVITTYVSDYKTELSYPVLDSYFKRFPVLFFMEQSSGLSETLQRVIKSYTSIEPDKTQIEPIDYNLIKNNSEKLSAYIKNESDLIKNNSEKLSAYIKNESADTELIESADTEQIKSADTEQIKSADTELIEKTLSELNNQLNNLNRELDELKNKCYDTCSTKYANNDLSKIKEDVAFAFTNYCTIRDRDENMGKSERIYLKECWEYNIIVSAIEPKIGILRARLKNIFKKPDVDVNEHLITLKENADIFYNNNVQKEKLNPSAGGKSKSRRRTRTRKIKNTRR